MPDAQVIEQIPEQERASAEAAFAITSDVTPVKAALSSVERQVLEKLKVELAQTSAKLVTQTKLSEAAMA